MEFTSKEQDRINQLYANNFEGIQPEDAELIARWEAWKATQESEHKAKVKAINAEMQARLQHSETLAGQAMKDLADLRDAAMARLERLG